ncbi:CGGC domain-containing protein [candidate division WOR-1 bacterium RIFOXYD2_FULL_36_8]|uniref:CGGC domain-containing protein n=1 Tax=candidate division WOR-1 bacterium RIFOXYB2_FULL_36_35 TaxID=1802578 RepID=A0A1F4S0Y2_UNCSA|nr:MAG: CGGC domain-containing protein [candidate division WOR-1 bacterium RIFOXYA2_FULL_36_21]OGC14105.1 MAG: CGGC domain-containing protein [candidate division WOR-1 bacterium RIFOXYB2_FULL_36_35]OGC16519.1 MAG: CGGC domain-containing protein [candidate division WOR-1 bacterium RIFOXYA12_FULL_36_13]OGC39715.1 MAG: CGGC domain-containing protein [candidate division WOR-1 bacterium RIFOXYD2_FULL_36_8]
MKKKIGIIRCQQTEDMCPGTTDFKIAANGEMAFSDIGSCEIVGFVSCGGCPGKKAVSRAKMMVERGAEIIVIASCISKGHPIGFVCPNFEKIKESFIKKLNSNIIIIDWTH